MGAEMTGRDECEHGSLRRKCLICELQGDLAESRAHAAALEEALREVEWEGRNMGRACCPSCGCLQPYSPPFQHEFVLKNEVPGHAPGCRLAALLDGGKGEGGGT
jgi:hypothetical protein